MKVTDILFIIFLSFLIINLNAAEKMVVRFNEPNLQIVREFRNDQHDVASYRPGEYLDIVVTESFYNELKARGLDISITQTEAQLKENLQSTRELDGYQTHAEINGQMLLYSYLYPDICELHVLGDTWGKTYYEAGNDNYYDYDQEIWGLKLSDNVSEEEDEPCVYYFGAHHAREPISAEMTMTILDHLLSNYGTDPEITESINSTQIWFIPVVNPNGHKIVTDELDVWWRKNIRDNNENGMLDEEDYGDYLDGVDPNRNYGFEWGLVGASDLWESQTYHGPGPISEPENQVVAELIGAHHFIAGISYHTHGEWVLFPYGYSDGVMAPDHDALQELAVAMAEQIPSQDYGYYTPAEAWGLYPCMGTLDDYAYGVRGIFSYTIEMATQFIPPAANVPLICEDNLDAALTLLDRKNHSILTGHVTDNATDLPLVAEIFIEGIDNSEEFRYPYLSNELYGSYYRLLTDGFYDVTISAYGYSSQTFENIEITSAEQTILNAALDPVPYTFLSGNVYNADTIEPVENCRIEIIDTPLEAVFTNSEGAYEFSDVAVDTYQVLLTAAGFSSRLESITLEEEDNVINFVLEVSEAESFELTEFGYEWSSIGDADWFIDNNESYDGFHSARSGIIGSMESTSLLITLNVIEEDEISFYKKVSCEDDTSNDNFDYLLFLIDDIEMGRWDGEIDWSLETFTVSAGQHTFEWRYEKDGYVSSGSDCAWIDYVELPEYDNTSSQETEDSPVSMKLFGNYPNPFNPETVISFSLNTRLRSNDGNYAGQAENTELCIYNAKGQRVKSFFLSFDSAQDDQESSRKVIWDGTNDAGQPVSSGIYFYKLQSGDKSLTRKMVLMK